MENLELYNEEQRDLLLKLNDGINNLANRIDQQIEQYTPPKDEVKVQGSVQVNTEKTVEVANLEDIKEWLGQFAGTVSKAIEDNRTVVPSAIKISNPDEVKAREVTVTNLNKLIEHFDDLALHIANNRPIVQTVNKELTLPIDPSKPIAVRLSDGKQFYNALTQIVAGASSPVQYREGDALEQGAIATVAGWVDGTTVHATSTSNPMPVEITGAAPGATGLLPFAFDDLEFSNPDGNGNYQTGTVRNNGTDLATLTLTYDASSNLTRITRTDI